MRRLKDLSCSGKKVVLRTGRTRRRRPVSAQCPAPRLAPTPPPPRSPHPTPVRGDWGPCRLSASPVTPRNVTSPSSRPRYPCALRDHAASATSASYEDCSVTRHTGVGNVDFASRVWTWVSTWLVGSVLLSHSLSSAGSGLDLPLV